MRKVENIIDIDGIERTLPGILNEYYTNIFIGSHGYLTPVQKLEKLINKYRKEPEHLKVIGYCIENFEEFVKATPIRLQEIVQQFNADNSIALVINRKSEKARVFSKNLLKAFSYEEFRKTKLLSLAKQLNIKVCPYCNSQYTLLVENFRPKSKLAKFQFDHFFPKVKYPFLSISFYNLIPSCASCNLRKGDKEFTLDTFPHPYIESFSDLTTFQIGDKEELDLLMAEKIYADKINIRLTNIHEPKVANYNETFDLQDIYARHKDIVREIYLKAYAYNKKNKDSLLAWNRENGVPFFKDIFELERLILGNYNLQEDINKRPLAKFMQDIAREAKLIE